MAHCELYPVPSREAPGFRWKWRTTNGQVRSESSFLFFYECVEDARIHGHIVDFVATLAAARQYAKEKD